MKRPGLTAAEVSKMLNVSKATIYGWCNGIYPFPEGMPQPLQIGTRWLFPMATASWIKKEWPTHPRNLNSSVPITFPPAVEPKPAPAEETPPQYQQYIATLEKLWEDLRVDMGQLRLEVEGLQRINGQYSKAIRALGAEMAALRDAIPEIPKFQLTEALQNASKADLYMALALLEEKELQNESPSEVPLV